MPIGIVDIIVILPLQIIAKVAGLLLTALAIQLMILGLTDLGLIERAVAQH